MQRSSFDLLASSRVVCGVLAPSLGTGGCRFGSSSLSMPLSQNAKPSFGLAFWLASAQLDAHAGAQRVAICPYLPGSGARVKVWQYRAVSAAGWSVMDGVGRSGASEQVGEQVACGRELASAKKEPNLRPPRERGRGNSGARWVSTKHTSSAGVTPDKYFYGESELTDQWGELRPLADLQSAALTANLPTCPLALLWPCGQLQRAGPS